MIYMRVAFEMNDAFLWHAAYALASVMMIVSMTIYIAVSIMYVAAQVKYCRDCEAEEISALSCDQKNGRLAYWM